MKLIVAILCLCFAQIHTPAQVEWKQIGPVCPGSTHAVAFPNNNSMMIVGTTGTGLRTTDSGNTWHSSNFWWRTKWLDVVCLANNTVVCVGADGRIARSTDQGVSWTFPQSTTTYDLHRVWTDSTNVVVAVGDSGALVRSNDAGETWTSIASECNSFMRYIGSSPIGRLLVFDTTNTMQYSDDKGLSWSVCVRDSAWQLLGCLMFTADSGIAIGDFDGIGITSDGGRTWVSETLANSPSVGHGTINNPDPRTRVFIARDSTGRFIAVYDNCKMAVSGASIREWTISTLTNNYREDVRDLETDATGQLWMVSSWALYQLNNSGADLHRFNFPNRSPVPDAIGLTDHGTIFMWAEHQLQMSNDTGNTWRMTYPAIDYGVYPNYIWSTQITRPNRWITSGMYVESSDPWDERAHYRAIESTDQGATWKELPLPTKKNTSYKLNVGENGASCLLTSYSLFVSTDDFKTSTRAIVADSNGNDIDLDKCLAVSAKLFLAYGTNRAIYRSIDSGRTLQKISIPTVESIQDMMFADEKYGLCVGYNGVVFVTTDAGATWNSVNAGVSVNLSYVFVKDRQTWVIGGDSLQLFITNNGGATWRDISIANKTYYNSITSFALLNNNTYIASGGRYSFLGYDAGGSTRVPHDAHERHTATLTISPNPTTNSATITVGDTSHFINVLDAIGNRVATCAVVEGRASINTSQFATGTYYVVSGTSSGVLMVYR